MINVLLIEDDHDHCDLIEALLGRMTGRDAGSVFAASRVHTVRDAIDCLASLRYGCVVLDHGLSDGLGTDVLREAAPFLLTTPVVGLSTSRDPEVAIEDFRGGCVEYISKHDAFRDGDLGSRLIAAIAKFDQRRLAILMERSNLATGLEELETLAREARADALTSLANRRVFEDMLALSHEQAMGEGRAYAIAMCDLDRFKLYNDAHGHLEGDAVLREYAKALAAAVPDGAVVARFGGEEFVVLWNPDDSSPPVAVATALNRAVRMLGIPHPHNTGIGQVTCSIGTACWRSAALDPTPAEVLGRADAAMYQAKQSGRDRACHA